MILDFGCEQLDQLINQSVGYFNLGQLLRYEPVGGNANKNFQVSTTKGEYIFKIVLEHSDEDLELELIYQKRLQENSFPAALYLSAPNGSQIFTNPFKSIVVMAKNNGIYPDSSIETCTKLGKDLARLHDISITGLPNKKHWLTQSYLSTAMSVILEHFPDKQQFVDAYKTLGSFPYQSLPKTIIHGDINEQNCLVSKSQITYIDWEEVGLAPAILDLGMAAINFCCNENGISLELFTKFIDAYQTVRPLSAIETKHLKLATQYAAFTLSVWAQLQFGLYLPNEQKIKTSNFYWDFNLDKFM